MRTVLCLALFAALPVLVVTSAAAAPVTWADPAGLCAGNLPCFTTLADAVANAGPAPAQVFVLPGTYPESIDLGAMGSALPGGASGELAIVSVDGGGQPAPGATVDPGAPGGPGTGDAIRATAFPAPLTLDGLVVRSPDLNGLFLTGGSANVTLRGVDASGSPMGNGVVVVNGDGTVEAIDSTARLNFNAGFNLASQAGQVTVSGSLAESNGGAGFSLVATSATVTDSQAETNGQDGWLITPSAGGGSLTLTNVVARGNNGQGLFSIVVSATDAFAVTTLTNLTLQNNANQGASIFGMELTVSQLLTEDNGGQGVGLFGETVLVQQLTSARNGDSGALIGATEQVTIQDALIEDNLDGGLGVVAADGDTATATASGLVASRNVGTGIAFGGVQDAQFATVDLVDATAIGNTEGGVGALGNIVTATQITANNNGFMGFFLDGSQLAEASFVTASGNQLGILVGGEGEARLTDSDASTNVTGVLMGGDSVTMERVNALLSGPGNGNPGSGSGFAFINANLLDVNNSRTEANEVGWFFLEIQTEGSLRSTDALQALGVGVPEALAKSANLAHKTEAAQFIRIATTQTLGNTLGSMFANLRDGASFRVSCSDFVANGPSGLELATANTLDARANYWGAASGPTHPDNPTGTGDTVTDGLSGGSGVVQWTQFLGVPATPEDCPVIAQDIPTLSPKSLAALALTLIATALFLLRRRRHVT